MRRWFKRFLPRLQQQLNIGAGVAGIAALLLALAGLIASSPTREVLIALGVTVAIVTVIVAVAKAWPPKIRSAADVEGLELPPADIQEIYPPVPAIGIVGAAGAGKTTLKNRLLVRPVKGHDKTQRVTAHIGPVIHGPTTYVALLDGRGDLFDQQFDVTDKSDILILMLDHSDIDTDHLDADRMVIHRNFGDQLRDRLRKHPEKAPRIHILFNKRDRWEKAPAEELRKLQQFFAEEVNKWTIAFGTEVTSAPHSNGSTDDMTSLISVIKKHWQRTQETAKAEAKK